MIVRGCTLFNNHTKYSAQTNPVKNIQNASRPQRVSNVKQPSFTALKGMTFLKRFDPEKSATAYQLIKNYEKSYAIRDFAKLYNIHAAFSTDWLKKHPNFPYKNTGDYFASITTMLLVAKKATLPENPTQQEIEAYKAEPFKYYYIGMYGDDSLTGSEENLAYYLTRFSYWNDIRPNLCDEPQLTILDPLPKRYYEL